MTTTIGKYDRTLGSDNYIEGYPDAAFDDKVAIMTQEDLDRLPEYSSSVPTGKVVGKVWKAMNRKTEAGWIVGSYEDEDPPSDKYLVIRWREVILVDH